MSDERIRVIRASLTDSEWRALKASAALKGKTLQEHASDLLRGVLEAARSATQPPPQWPDYDPKRRPDLKPGDVVPVTRGSGVKTARELAMERQAKLNEAKS